MYRKKWHATWSGNAIVVENAWDFSGNSEEKISVNGELIKSRAYNAYDKDVNFDEIKKLLGTTEKFDYGPDEVVVKVGSAWHLCGMACRIEVNGKYIGGNRIVLFANRDEN